MLKQLSVSRLLDTSMVPNYVSDDVERYEVQHFKEKNIFAAIKTPADKLNTETIIPNDIMQFFNFFFNAIVQCLLWSVFYAAPAVLHKLKIAFLHGPLIGALQWLNRICKLEVRILCCNTSTCAGRMHRRKGEIELTFVEYTHNLRRPISWPFSGPVNAGIVPKRTLMASLVVRIAVRTQKSKIVAQVRNVGEYAQRSGKSVCQQ